MRLGSLASEGHFRSVGVRSDLRTQQQDRDQLQQRQEWQRCSAGAASRIRKQQMAAECARADVRDERRVWTAQRQPLMRQQPHRLVFLDETFVNTKMGPPARSQPQRPAVTRACSLRTLGHAHLHRGPASTVFRAACASERHDRRRRALGVSLVEGGGGGSRCRWPQK
jgi:hypothetical protein